MTDDNDTAITVCQLDSLRNLFLNGTDITAVIEKERVMSGWDAKISRFLSATVAELVLLSIKKRPFSPMTERAARMVGPWAVALEP